jgi:flavin reductase (DIM6/NTAB) family NADH-FMN oxidoreductase RutF
VDIDVRRQMCTQILQRPTLQRRSQARFSTLPQLADEESKAQEKKLIPETLRHLMRGIPSSVVVLTTSVTKPDLIGAAQRRPESYYRGMTLSSFTTLSLAPPLITFNIRAPSRTLSAIRQSKAFFIHVLETNQEAATIADSFTRGNTDGHEVSEAFRPRYGSFKVQSMPFELQYASGSVSGHMEVDLPRLVGKGVKRVLGCELYRNPTSLDPSVADGLIEVGEHVLVVAKVTAIFPNEGLVQTEKEEEYALSYVDGRYRMVGRTIMAHDTKNDAVRRSDGIV